MVDTLDVEAASRFILNFEKDEDGVRPHEVPAAALTQALSGVQRIVHLVAMHQEQREIRTRARVTQDIEQRFPVMCHVPAPGSYDMPVSIGTPALDPVDPGLTVTVTDLFRNVLEALSGGDLAHFRELIPDAAYRKNISKAARDAAPGPRMDYRFRVLGSGGRCIFDAHDALPHIEDILRPVPEPVEMTSVVTGKFIRVDFEARKLEILHPETNKMLDCLYQDDVESLLLNNPRELIQVVGTVELNADGAPVRITDVQDILEVDLSPISLFQVPLEHGQLTAHQPMALFPTLSETKQFYEIEYEELGISLIAFTRDELIEALNEEIAVLWTEYAQERDDALTNGAQALKDRLLKVFKDRN